MKTLTFSALALLGSAALWVTHLPSPNPINGAFIMMCACAGMTFRFQPTSRRGGEDW